MFRKFYVIVLTVSLILSAAMVSSAQESTPDTGQTACFDNSQQIACPQEGQPFFGQDAQYQSAAPAYIDNGDGTVTDLNTGLMWQKTPGAKLSWNEAVANAGSFNLAGYTDWRLPTIKELYSLIDFNGVTGMEASSSIPYIDTAYFDFYYGDTSAGERMIDAQYWSSTEYVSSTMGGQHTIFGVNFADGRIKGYGDMGGNMLQYVRHVRGGSGYGANSFIDNGSGTITDQATGLMWMQDDSGAFGAGSAGDGSLNWQEALAWCEGLDYAGYTDWRLPSAKELQYIVDYSRSPDTTNSAAIDPIFHVTGITNELGQADYPYFWTNTTHVESMGAQKAAYIAFGRALGYMNGQYVDVHGAGAQRSDIKFADRSEVPFTRGPQGDVIRVYNYARCVRGGSVSFQANPDSSAFQMPQGNGQPPQDGQGQGQSQPGGQGQQQPGGQGQQGPPQEAITACTGLSQGNACSFNTPNGDTISGTCNTINQQLACMPAGGR